MGFFGLFNKETKIGLQESMQFLQGCSEKVLSPMLLELKRTSESVDAAKKEIQFLLEKLPEEIEGSYSKREIQIMEGNRQVYIKKTQDFLKKMDIACGLLELNDKIETMESQMNEYHSSSSRAYYVMTNFCDDIMKEIASRLKIIESSIQKLRSISKDERIIRLKAIQAAINDLLATIDEKDKTESDLKILTGELDSEQRKLQDLRQKKVDLQDSRDFSEFNSLESRRKEINSTVSRLNSRLLNDLDVFSRAARKFSRGDNLMSIYLEDPLKALGNDPNLEILKVIEKIKIEISFGHLDVKQKDKLLHSDMNKDYFDSARSEYENLKKSRSEVASKQNRLSIMMEYNDLEYKIEHHESKEKKLRQDIEERKNLLEHLHTDLMMKKLEERMSDFSGRKIIIETIK